MKYRMTIFACRCGRVFQEGNWVWKRIYLSLFLREIAKRNVVEIAVQTKTCPACDKQALKFPKREVEHTPKPLWI